jgi:cell division protein FtsQ
MLNLCKLIPVKRIGNLFLIFFIVLILPCTFLIAAKNGIFKVHNIEVITLQDEEAPEAPLAYQDYLLKLKAKLAKFDGTNLWSIDLQLVYEVAASEGWVSSVEIYRRFPQTLRVEIKTKPSVAIFMNNQGELHLISRDGQLLPRITETQAPKLPVISDSRIVKSEKIKSRVVKALNEFPTEGPLNLQTLTEVTLGSKEEVWFTHLDTKSLIKLGDENIAIKSARVAKVLEYLDHNNLKGRVIDADFSKKVLVKLRNDR